MLIKKVSDKAEIRFDSARGIFVSAAALLATASSSVSAVSVDERSTVKCRTAPEGVYSNSGVLDFTSAMSKTQKRQPYYGALLHLPNEAIFWPAPLKSNGTGQHHE